MQSVVTIIIEKCLADIEICMHFFFSFVFFQALNGFLMILTCDGEVFFATHSIESYLGFHQVSDRRMFKKYLQALKYAKYEHINRLKD